MTVSRPILQSLDYGSIRKLGLMLSCIVLFSLGCDQTGMALKDDLTLTPVSTAVLTNGTIKVELRNTGSISQGHYYPNPSDMDLITFHMLSGGIWLAANQDIFRANATTGVTRPIPRFELVPTGSDRDGVFHITRDSLDSNILNWPVEIGAPVEIDGRPKLYGDQMAWGALQPTSAIEGDNASVDGLRIGVSLYLYDQGPLSNAFFVRYDIQNTSSVAISNLHLGFNADTDLVKYDHFEPLCGPLDEDENHTGYDLQNHITYTYLAPDLSYGPLPEDCYGTVVGYSILEMSQPGGFGEAKLAHRILRRRTNETFPEFAGGLIVSSEHILLALQGLSPSGGPMIDPSTGSSTLFAFTGDPVSETGWIDDRHDSRSLQSIEPINLGPGEVRSMTVVWLIADGDNLESGINLLKSQFALVMSRRDLWDY